ncbi:MAG: peptidase M48 [Sphingomonas sp. SCN 67-18]|uniref:M48 family metalloprotease n=1 Tax=uncultured Sphingomonas sp. TaxID=158754 RepID=UPI00086F77FC|nr:M48 family metalloprotease [Sphingomonas sp. SCN 67-18]ODU22103.1 MAG: peptidase M48 [Sphingomonas sp. SCN 67-18]
MAEQVQFDRFARRFVLRLMIVLILAFAALGRPALAQSILRDAETEALFADMSKPLIVAAGLDPRNVKIVLLYDKEINAFVAGGQIVYIHSGLINAADNANQVQGVIAHELGHIQGGHIVRFSEGMKTATGITLLSLLIGAAAIAAGAGEAGMGILSAGQQAAMGKFLAFTRTQESSADEAGARYLAASGISGRGSLEFFKKLQNQEFRLAIPQDNSYARTHPLSGERIAILRERYEIDPAWNAKTDPALEARFQRVKAKLRGFIADPKQTLRDYPETDRSITARYARAYAWHRSAYPDKALEEVKSLVAEQPDDPYFLELEGQIFLESGHPADALPALRRASQLTNNQPLIAALFGHALIATEDSSNFAEAERVLRSAISRDNDNPFAWYQLGVVYDRKGDRPRAALATAERYNLEGSARFALANAEVAMAGLPEGTPDWLRAQDIAFVSRTAVAEEKRKR